MPKYATFYLQYKLSLIIVLVMISLMGSGYNIINYVVVSLGSYYCVMNSDSVSLYILYSSCMGL